MPTAKNPKWLTEYVERVQGALGLQVWAVEVIPDQQPNPDNPSADATTYADARYLFAKIRYRPEYMRRPNAANKVLIIHELLHVAAAELDLATERVINGLLPEEQREFAHTLIEDANERYVVRLSRQLYRMLENNWEGANLP